jgi:hypothetical protein
MLRLDHLILRSGNPEGTLAMLRDAAGLPVLAPVQAIGGGMRSGLLRAGPVDVEVLGVGAEPPATVEGYGLGLAPTGEAPLAVVVADLRAAGLATSAVLRGHADGRAWEVVQVAGLLPEPFPVPATTRPPGAAERLAGTALARLAAVPAVARAASRRPGRSMVVVTRYGFDVEAWRASAAGGPGPAIAEVEVGVGPHRGNWARLGALGGPPLVLDPDGEPGIRRVVLTGPGWEAGRALQVGAVSFVGR